MSKTFSAEFIDDARGRASLLQACAELLQAGRQFAVTPRFDVTPGGPVVKAGFILSWPAAAPTAPEAPRGDEKTSA